MGYKRPQTKKAAKKKSGKQYVVVPKELTRQIKGPKGRREKLELDAHKLEKTKTTLQNFLKNLDKTQREAEHRFIVQTDELKQEKSKLNQITSTMTTGAILLNNSGRVLFVNRAARKLLGLRENDTKKALQALYKTLKEAPVKKHVEKCLEGESTKISEVLFDDKIFEVSFRCCPKGVRHKEHFPGHFIWIRDVTEEKLFARSKNELVAVVSHQLRTPLTVIKGNTEMLLDKNFGPLNDEQQEMIMQTAEANERLIRLINDMLDLAKMQTKKLRMVMEPVSIGETLELIVSDLRFYAKKHAAFVHYTKPEQEIPAVMGDKIRLRQVFQNLIENSIRYCRSPEEKKCSVRISVDISDTSLTVHIADNGIGIPKKEQPKMFQRFYRASNAVKHDSHGSGLGLSTVKSIVDKLQGDIRFDSKENEGTTFHVTFPIAKK